MDESTDGQPDGSLGSDPTSAPTDAAKDRVSNWRIAWVAAGAAVLGGIVTGVFTLIAGFHQTDSQAQDDLRNYMRDHQGSTYAKLATDARRVEAIYEDCRGKASSRHYTMSWAQYDAYGNKLDKIASEVIEDISTVEFVASDATSRSASTLYGDITSGNSVCMAAVYKHVPASNTKLDEAALVGLQSDVQRVQRRLHNDINTFLSAGRHDIHDR